MSHYTAASTPASKQKNGGNEQQRFAEMVEQTSKSIAKFNQTTKSMQQKIGLFGTPQDSRANHQQLKELTERGNKLVAKINNRLQELTKASQTSTGRSHRTQVSKLSSDFKGQVKLYEETCAKLVQLEQNAIETIRRQSSSFRYDDAAKTVELGNYNEDQLYSQANVTNYDEDDLARREEDLIHINHQLREVNAAYREIDDLVNDQGDVVVEIEENAENTKEHVGGALENVRQADAKRSYCNCSKTKLICYSLLMIVIAALVLALVFGLKK